MDDLFVDGCADAPLEPRLAQMAPVVQKGGNSALAADRALGDLIEVLGGHARPDGLSEPVQGSGDDQPGLAHQQDLRARFDLDFVAAAHSVRLTSSRRAVSAWWVESILVSAKRLERPVGDVVHRAGRIDTYQNASCGVKRDERSSLFRVHLEPMTDGLRHVVVTLEEVTAAPVAQPLAGRRVEVDVPDRAAAPAGAATGQPAHDLVVIDHELQHDVQLVAEIREQLLEGLGLRNGAREAVEQEAP